MWAGMVGGDCEGEEAVKEEFPRRKAKRPLPKLPVTKTGDKKHFRWPFDPPPHKKRPPPKPPPPGHRGHPRPQDNPRPQRGGGWCRRPPSRHQSQRPLAHGRGGGHHHRCPPEQSGGRLGGTPKQPPALPFGLWPPLPHPPRCPRTLAPWPQGNGESHPPPPPAFWGQPDPKTNPLPDPKTNPPTNPKINPLTNPKAQNNPTPNPTPDPTQQLLNPKKESQEV